MGSPPPLRCGVAGVGYLGQHHARLYADLPETTLVGVFDTDPRRAKEIAAAHGTVAFPTLEALGAACEAVSVVTPTDTHAAVALPLLAQGCHLLIEKPIGTTLEEAQAISAAAQQRGLTVQVGHVEHYNPVMAFLEKHVRDPAFIMADRLAPFKERGLEVSVVLDLMIHDIGIVLRLAQAPVVRVDAVGVSVLSPSVDLANARLEFANGCVATLNASRVSQTPKRELRLFQTEGYLSLNFAEQRGHVIRRGPLPLPGKLGLIKQEVPIEKGEPLRIELASFAQAIRRQLQPKVDAQLGTNALAIAIEISALIAKRQAPAGATS